MAILTPDQQRFLDEHRVARLATVDEQGRPHVVPVCFALVRESLFTAIDEKPKRVAGTELRRIHNILARPEVCLLVDRYEEDWTQLAWLQIRGRADLVSDDVERAAALVALRARYPQYQAMNLEALPLIRIAPTQLVAWSATR